MRIFIALDIDDAIRERLQLFMDGVRGFAPEVRWVRNDSLHVTLKFIGNKAPEEVEEIRQALTGVTANTAEISFRGYGFFPTARAPRVFWVGVEAGPQLAAIDSDFGAEIDRRDDRIGDALGHRRGIGEVARAARGTLAGDGRRCETRCGRKGNNGRPVPGLEVEHYRLLELRIWAPRKVGLQAA